MTAKDEADMIDDLADKLDFDIVLHVEIRDEMGVKKVSITTEELKEILNGGERDFYKEKRLKNCYPTKCYQGGMSFVGLAIDSVGFGDQPWSWSPFLFLLR